MTRLEILQNTAKQNFTTHGLSTHKLYDTWHEMKRRCYNTNRPAFERYGGKGIEVCDEWKDDFIAFYDWALFTNWKDTLSIDRIDNAKGYSPDNCRWADPYTQAINRGVRKTSATGFKGSTLRKNGMYRSRITVDKKQIALGTYKTAIEAAKAYDSYIVVNNTGHQLNGVDTFNSI